MANRIDKTDAYEARQDAARNENHHGYRHSDGEVRDYPEVKGAAAHGVADMAISDLSLDDQHVLATRIAANLGYKLVEEDEIEPMRTSQAQYDRAFATWAKAFKDWQAEMAEWKAKHGRK